jgi:hypothetical protein
VEKLDLGKTETIQQALDLASEMRMPLRAELLTGELF